MKNKQINREANKNLIFGKRDFFSLQHDNHNNLQGHFSSWQGETCLMFMENLKNDTRKLC